MIRKLVIQIFKICVSVILVGFLLRRIGIENILKQFQMVQLNWLAGGLLIFSLSHLLGSYQWMLLLRNEGIPITWRKTVSFYYVGLFFNNFLISSLGGDLFRMVDIRRYSKKGTSAVSTVFLDRFMGLLVLSGIAVFMIPWVLIQKKIVFNYNTPVILFSVGWIFILLLLFNKRFAQPFSWVIRQIIPPRLSVKAREVYRKTYSFGRQKNLLMKVVLLSIIIQSARILMHYFVCRSLGVEISPCYFFLIIPIVAIMASMPVTIGGIGLREQTSVLLFGMVGMVPEVAASMEFIAFLIAILSSVPGGVLFIVRKKVSQGNENVV